MWPSLPPPFHMSTLPHFLNCVPDFISKSTVTLFSCHLFNHADTQTANDMDFSSLFCLCNECKEYVKNKFKLLETVIIWLLSLREIQCQTNMKCNLSKCMIHKWMTRSELNSDVNLWKLTLKWLRYIGKKAECSVIARTSACCRGNAYGVTSLRNYFT